MLRKNVVQLGNVDNGEELRDRYISLLGAHLGYGNVDQKKQSDRRWKDPSRSALAHWGPGEKFSGDADSRSDEALFADGQAARSMLA